MLDFDAVLRFVESQWRHGDVAEVDVTVDLPEQTLTVTLRRQPFRLDKRDTDGDG
jgi:hypothetical protein